MSVLGAPTTAAQARDACNNAAAPTVKLALVQDLRVLPLLGEAAGWGGRRGSM